MMEEPALPEGGKEKGEAGEGHSHSLRLHGI